MDNPKQDLGFVNSMPKNKYEQQASTIKLLKEQLEMERECYDKNESDSFDLLAKCGKENEKLLRDIDTAHQISREALNQRDAMKKQLNIAKAAAVREAMESGCLTIKDTNKDYTKGWLDGIEMYDEQLQRYISEQLKVN